MDIRWSPLALSQLEDIFRQHKDYSITAAQDICRTIYREAGLLANFPLMGKRELHLMGKHPYRSLISKNRRYKIMYYIDCETIHIATIWDCRRNPQTIVSLLGINKRNENK